MGYGALIGLAVGLVATILFTPKVPGARKSIDDDTPETSNANGFGGIQLGESTPISVIFGTVHTNGNLIRGHVLGAGNQRFLGVMSIAEYTGSPDPVLSNLYVSGLPYNELSTYSAGRADDKSWFEWYPAGEATTVNVNNAGSKPISEKITDGDEHVSYPVELYGDNGSVSFNINHYAPEEGSSQSWIISYKNGISGNWIALGSYSQVFRKSVEYEVPSGCGSTTKTAYVESWTRTTHDFTGLPEGVIYFRVAMSNGTNAGYLLWENVDITGDPGRDVVFKSPGTSYVLINLIKTDEVRRMNFRAEVNYKNENAADAIRFLLEDQEIGLGLGSQIDNASFVEASSWCAANGRTIGIALANIAFDRALELLLESAGLYMVKTGGTFKLRPDRNDAPVATLYKDTDMLPGSFEWGASDRQTAINRLRVKYTDSADGHTKNDVIVEDFLRVSEDGYLREKTIDLSPVRTLALAQRRAEEIYNREDLSDTWCSFSVGIKRSTYEPGDIIQVVNDDIAWGDVDEMLFRVAEMEEITADEGMFGYQVSCIKHDPKIYTQSLNWNNWKTDNALPTFQAEPPEVVESIAISNITQSEHLSSTVGEQQAWEVDLAISFMASGLEGIAGYRLYGKPEYEDDYSLIESVASTDSAFTARAVEPYVTWRFKVVMITTDGDTGNLLAAPFDSFYPQLINATQVPGFGGGYFGAQPYGA